MKPEIRTTILDIFMKNSGYARTKEILDQGIHNIYLKELEKEGIIQKVKHGLYSLTDHENYNSMHEALLAVSNAIICMGSALAYYDLTTWNPTEVHLAIRHGRKIVLPVYPPIQLYHFSGKFFETGQTTIALESGHRIRIYDKEKTICDIVRYRNRIGIDIMKEALNEYVKQKDINLNKLYTYAGDLNIRSVLDTYLEVLI
ncbi:MAG: type IV toxin-antitoxin system AbiEi family antitoxin domain-containing protein [Spirochaetales bacterium]|nr:type IV toxin-antitoxin system AbiEi family antitoxin domain-containing protein [Spirochaetales bacterium]